MLHNAADFWEKSHETKTIYHLIWVTSLYESTALANSPERNINQDNDNDYVKWKVFPFELSRHKFLI